ncbi:MAG TPA: glycosyltransferase family 2 protein [Solirubrobacteraceae bacterium]|nr:glycosyltransferase family 2 protein [Solirubrobacteraceae bacterium]
MKLIIQIPCFDEARTLPLTLADLPREVAGFDAVEWLVVDDGSSDGTAEVARRHGVEHLVRLSAHRGLAAAFQAGLDAALKLGADVIVNTDGDNQYAGADVHRLVEPIVAGRADMVVGDRTPHDDAGSPAAKRGLRRLGGFVVRSVSGLDVADPASGFRAYTRDAALQVQVVSEFTYTVESTIEAGRQIVAVEQVPVRTNPQTRPSRLFPSVWVYARRNALAIFRVYSRHEPLRVFWCAALVLFLVAAAIWARFLYFLVADGGRGHVQSLLLGAVLFNAAMLLGALGVIGDLLHAQRVLAQRTLERVRRIELALEVPPARYERMSEPESSAVGAAHE